MHSYRTTRVGPGDAGTRFEYEGPHGPMTVVIGDDGTPTSLTGPALPAAATLQAAANPMESWRALPDGLRIDVAGTPVRVVRERKGLTRAARGITVELPGGPALLRLRRWDRPSLERAGEPLAQGGILKGSIAEAADPVAVASWLLLLSAGLHLDLGLT